jgi:hypothetical protein
MLTVTSLLSGLKALTCSKLGLCHWKEHNPVRQFVLYEVNLGWLNVWKLNPEVRYEIPLTSVACKDYFP